MGHGLLIPEKTKFRRNLQLSSQLSLVAHHFPTLSYRLWPNTLPSVVEIQVARKTHRWSDWKTVPRQPFVG